MLSVPIQYDREAAVAYAHRWAYDRNPDYYNYDNLGGDCTNFASQCLYAGVNVMNFTPTFGWYYINANQKAPAWTGVPYFGQFLTRKEPMGPGPIAVVTDLSGVEPGDFVQFRFYHQEVLRHTPIIVAVGNPPTLDNTLVAAHSYDADNRPLSTYEVDEMVFLHILGANPKKKR